MAGTEKKSKHIRTRERKRFRSGLCWLVEWLSAGALGLTLASIF